MEQEDAAEKKSRKKSNKSPRSRGKTPNGVNPSEMSGLLKVSNNPSNRHPKRANSKIMRSRKKTVDHNKNPQEDEEQHD